MALTLATVPPHPPGNRLQLPNSVGWPASDTKHAGNSAILDDASPHWEEQARAVQWRYARPNSYRRTATRQQNFSFERGTGRQTIC